MMSFWRDDSGAVFVDEWEPRILVSGVLLGMEPTANLAYDVESRRLRIAVVNGVATYRVSEAAVEQLDIPESVYEAELLSVGPGEYTVVRPELPRRRTSPVVANWIAEVWEGQ